MDICVSAYQFRVYTLSGLIGICMQKVRHSLDKAGGNMYGAHRALGIIANERSAL